MAKKKVVEFKFSEELSLKEWIDRVKMANVARTLNVTEGAVRYWRKGWVIPHKLTMLKIEKLSGGAVTIPRIIADHCAPANKKNRFKSEK